MSRRQSACKLGIPKAGPGYNSVVMPPKPQIFERQGIVAIKTVQRKSSRRYYSIGIVSAYRAQAIRRRRERYLDGPRVGAKQSQRRETEDDISQRAWMKDKNFHYWMITVSRPVRLAILTWAATLLAISAKALPAGGFGSSITIGRPAAPPWRPPEPARQQDRPSPSFCLPDPFHSRRQ